MADSASLSSALPSARSVFRIRIRSQRLRVPCPPTLLTTPARMKLHGPAARRPDSTRAAGACGHTRLATFCLASGVSRVVSRVRRDRFSRSARCGRLSRLSRPSRPSCLSCLSPPPRLPSPLRRLRTCATYLAKVHTKASVWLVRRGALYTRSSHGQVRRMGSGDAKGCRRGRGHCIVHEREPSSLLPVPLARLLAAVAGC